MPFERSILRGLAGFVLEEERKVWLLARRIGSWKGFTVDERAESLSVSMGFERFEVREREREGEFGCLLFEYL